MDKVDPRSTPTCTAYEMEVDNPINPKFGFGRVVHRTGMHPEFVAACESETLISPDLRGPDRAAAFADARGRAVRRAHDEYERRDREGDDG